MRRKFWRQQVMYIAAGSLCASLPIISERYHTHTQSRTVVFQRRRVKKRTNRRRHISFNYTTHTACVHSEPESVSAGPLSFLQFRAAPFLTPWNFQPVNDCNIASASLHRSENRNNSDPLKSATPILICSRGIYLTQPTYSLSI